MAIRHSQDSFFSSQPSRQRRRRAQRQAMRRELHIESLEDRRVMAGPQLVSVNPNEGALLQNGTVLDIAPRSITFRFDEGQQIAPNSLNGIKITQSGFDGVFGQSNDIVVTPGFIGIGENPNEVVVRFLSTLPDDAYRIDIFGKGATPLKNVAGEVFNSGVDQRISFELDLGAQIVAVVPQPIRRTGFSPGNQNGTLVQDRDTIVVYFNNDDLRDDITSAENPAFYQLIFTNDTVTDADDVVHLPISVQYDATADTATLKFSGDLSTLSGAGTYRLRIGTDEALDPLPPLRPALGGDAGSSFATATDLGSLTTLGAGGKYTSRSKIISAAIDPKFLPLQVPGANDEPGHRDIDTEVPGENHLTDEDIENGVPTFFYNFKDVYGTDPQGNVLHNVITEAQKQRAREILEFYSYYAGVQFQESQQQGSTPPVGFSIVTGDLRAVKPTIQTGPGGIAGIAVPGVIAIMDNAETWDDNLGGNWMSVAMHEIGHVLGLDHTYDLPVPGIMGNSPSGVVDTSEAAFPGDQDIVHIQHLYRPDSTDIDLYEFTLDTAGQFSAQTFSERLTTPSLLDSVLTLYRQNAAGEFEQIARNDDYFSEDSFVELQLEPGTYHIAVTSTGNVNFDPTIQDSGFGGTTQGNYELRLNFRPEVDTTIVDATGVAFDGDNDGRPGGVNDFWFRTQTTARTLIVDSIAPAGGNGSLATPYNRVSQAFTAAQSGDVIRIIGNEGPDGNINTLGDNRAYEIGFGALNVALRDGSSMRVPKGVTVMIEAGAIFKLKKAAIEVGSSSASVDLSRSGLQVLGTPTKKVFFTSYDNEQIGEDVTNPLPTSPVAGNWGGLLFRNDLDRAAKRFDYEAQGIFLNYVNHADISYGGGSVVISSVLQTVTPVQMLDARPTVGFNTITDSADAAISANPNSFEETNFHAPAFQTALGFTLDYGRIGPAIYGNTLQRNTTNGLFVRIRTPAGNALQEMTVAGRFNDTDIVHVISENLVVNGSPGGTLQNLLTGVFEVRYDARLMIDPGMIVKLDSSRIEIEPSAQFIAEGRAGQEVIFTSLFDDRYGAGGTFDTSNNGNTVVAAPGKWGGVYVGIAASANIDHALFAYGGGSTRIEGTFATFNTVEIHQAGGRITNSIFENNADGTGGTAPAGRFGRTSNASGTVFIRSAQPVIVNNVFRSNAGPAITANVNALNHLSVVDMGRTTGPIDLVPGYGENSGPLVRLNRLSKNSINGMVVRGAVLTTESVWDDTDIVHVVLDEIGVPDFHTYGGLRLQSSAGSSLVIKLQGDDAGFTASGHPLEIDDRIGGMIHVIGQPGFPVVFTSLKDDSVGALFVTDTNFGAGPTSTPAPGDWRSIKLEKYSHDRNVEVINELEPTDVAAPGPNATPDTARFLGNLAPNEKSGDENLRLGYLVHGFLNDPADVDVYSFNAAAGTEVWIDIDRTNYKLDTVVELINAVGEVIARSDDSYFEGLNPGSAFGTALLMQKLQGYKGQDFWTWNEKDAGMRLVLPGSLGTTPTYHVRVRSKSADLDGNLLGGETSGVYQLQIRLREIDELPGSTIRFADIRYATTGIELLGQPIHSPLLGEATELVVPNELLGNAQNVGNILASDRGAVSVAGNITAAGDVDWYRFNVNYASIQGLGTARLYAATVFDLDYADGLARANMIVSVFDSAGNLVLTSRDSNIVEDRPAPVTGSAISDLGGGSAGALDPYIGTVELPEGDYFVAVTSNSQIPTELNQYFVKAAANPLLRLEPITSITRIVEDHILSPDYTTAVPPEHISILDNSSAVPFHLGDVTLFVSTGGTTISTVDPFTGAPESYTGLIPRIGVAGRAVGDIAMRHNGKLYGYSFGFTDADSGNYLNFNTGTAVATQIGDDGIDTYEQNPDDPTGQTAIRSNDGNGNGIQFNAMTFGVSTGYINSGTTLEHYGWAVGNRVGNPLGIRDTQNILYQFDPDAGFAFSFPNALGDRDGNRLLQGAGTTKVERGALDTIFDPIGTANNSVKVAEPTTLTTAIVNNVPVTTTNRIIQDGMILRVNNGVNPAKTFEFNTGPEVKVNWDPATDINVRDGNLFTLDGQAYEFNTGPVLVMTAQNGLGITDGEQFRVFNALGISRVFEYDDGSGPPIGSGITKITFNSGMSQADLAIATANTISNVGNFNVVATAIGNRITLTGDSLTTPPVNISTLNLSIQGGTGAATPGSLLIQVEENLTTTQFNLAMLGRFNGPTIFASIDGTRLNFSGAINGDFTDIVNRGVFVDQFVDGNVGAGNIPINFRAADTRTELAVRIATALNAAGITATQVAEIVTLTGSATFTAAPAPFTVGGSAPGGTITGIAFLDSRMYAVSNAGGLFEVFGYSSLGASSDYIQQSTDLLGIQFAGLAAGPDNVENGAYSDLLFAIDTSGVLYAFNALGELQHIFNDGADRVDTGLGGVTGLAFSNLDYNLWHTGGASRKDDPGHGINADFGVMERPQGVFGKRTAPGGTSLYFGFENQVANGIPDDPFTDPGNRNNYDFPGGAHGSLESKTFSLEGYTASDQPTMYLNYFLDTEDAIQTAARPMLDSFRVFIRDDSGQWQQLAKNNDVAEAGQLAFDSSGTWRQLRISLGAYAGKSNLRLRFDFDTGGSMDVGNPDTGGTELRALSGDKLRDGQSFTIDGTDTFEFDLGYTLVLPTSDRIADGERFTVKGVIFEFNTTGSSGAGAIPILVPAGLSAAEVTELVRSAINANVPGVTLHVHDNRINLEGLVPGDLTAGASVVVEGAPGTTGTPMVITSDFSEVEVAAVMQQALADVYAAGDVDIIKTYNELVRIVGHVVTNAGPLGITSILPGDHRQVPLTPLTPITPPFGVLDGFHSPLRGQNNNFEGVYIDDIIIGLAGRGEMATASNATGTYTSNPAASGSDIKVGQYQLEMRRSSAYALGFEAPRLPDLAEAGLYRSFDIRDRLSDVVTLLMPAGVDIREGNTFTLRNGIDEITFEFVGAGAPANPNRVLIPFSTLDTASQIATKVAQAMNFGFFQGVFIKDFLRFTAGATGTGDRLDLFGQVIMVPGPTDPSQVIANNFEEFGDRNRFRDQGVVLIQSNRITNVEGFGIVSDASAPDGDGNLRHGGPPRQLLELDTARWAAGVTIMNNIISGAGLGGIQISGESDASQLTVVPFARVINNTLYDPNGPTGTGVGIDVRNYASPSLLNNVIANFATGIQVDTTSTSTVIGGALYQNNGVNTSNIGEGEFALPLQPNQPLFVNAAQGNFYLLASSPAIDSSMDSLTDRDDLVRVTDPLGISRSPILAPDRDGLGQLRTDDPNVSPPSGLGDNVFKDRGAIDRVDSIGPTAVLFNPRDNDAGGIDLDPALTSLTISGNTIITDFSVQFVDGLLTTESLDGVGVDPTSVTPSTVTLTRDGVVLLQGTDYSYSYDPASSRLRLSPLIGFWLPGFTYVLTLDNQVIRDLAGNLLMANQLTGETMYTIKLNNAQIDFGDAPDPTYPTLLANNGPQHIINELFLGASVTAETNGQPSTAANLDGGDNGVVIPTLNPGSTSTITVTASVAGGFLDAWIDFNADGDWNDVGEQIFASEPMAAGANVLLVSIPATAPIGNSYARFRLSNTGGLLPSGLAASGEVEDYRVSISTLQLDFGDAPAPYPTTIANDGARHITGTLFLGASVDGESDGQPSAAADGDGADENGVVFNTPLKLNTKSTITVTASQAGLLDAWIDYNRDGDWNDPGERIFNARAVVAGSNPIDLPPLLVTAVRDQPTFMRFRLSTTGGLLPTGESTNGEVEDYQVTITGKPWQNGNQPLDANGFGVDVNGDGMVTPTDILLVDSELKNRVYSNAISGALPPTPLTPPAPPPYFDVNGDGLVTPSDVLAVVAAFNLVISTPRTAPPTVGTPSARTQIVAPTSGTPSTTTSAPVTPANPAVVTTSVVTSSVATTSAATTSRGVTSAPASAAVRVAAPVSSTTNSDTTGLLASYYATQVVSAQATTPASTTPAKLAARTAPAASKPVLATSTQQPAAVQLIDAVLLEDDLAELVDTIADDVDEAWQSESVHDQVFALIE